jgi:release factor glutamine methyltransferase
MREQLQIADASTPATVRRLLQRGAEFLSGAGVESARLDAELLLSRLLGWSREELWLKDQALVEAAQMRRFEFALWRRGRREPVAYITGAKEFWSLDFLVGPEVLVPRPETELLVEIALGLMKSLEVSDSKLRVLDLGTGSGAIAVSLAKENDRVEVWATDLSTGALKVAAANAARHGVREKIHLLQGDLFGPLKGCWGSFHMILCNPPYLRRNEIQDLPPEIRDWEPRSALDGGVDGLHLYRRIIRQGHLYLADGGMIALEIGADMADEVCQLFSSAGCYSTGSAYRDYARRDRVVVARKL